ncbi:MAG TPA: M56 family metallopeptidase [Gemmatimonadaceae bacterium]|nr:M56 family metallopeptidase [Gemmatimonadaceae bacterium]
MNLSSLLASGAVQSWNLPLVLLLIKATTILVAALGITLAMQRASAGARHLVWLVTLGALVLIPVLTAWAPLRLEVLPARAVAAPVDGPRTMEAPVATDAAPKGTIASNAAANATAPIAAAGVADGTMSATSRLLAAIGDASLWSIALVLWGVVALAIVASLTWSALVVRRLVRRSDPLDDQSWLTPLYEVSDRLGLREPPRLLMSRDAKMPFACGLATPTIVLPAECEQWSQERRLAVLLHELAHVRRRDLLGHTLGRVVCAVYWFHPLVWTAARQLRAESERACDDLALACGTRATDYAEHLLDIVTSVRREATPMVALAMARRKEFEGRMLAILDPELRHSTPSRTQSATLIGTLALISIVVGAATPVPASARQAVAQDAAHRDTVRHPAAIVNDESTPSASIVHEANVANDRAQERELKRTRTEERMSTSERVDKAIVTTIEKNLERNAESIRERVAEAIGVAVPNAVARAASKAIVNTSNTVNVTMQDLLTKSGAQEGKRGADERAALLARVLRSDSSASLRRVAAWGLSEYAEEPVAVEALVSAVRRDASESVREMAAWSLADSDQSGPAIDALAAALRDASVAVRKTAAWSLGNIGDRRAMEPLVGALADASPEVRSRAVWSIGNVEPKQAPRQLVAMLSDRDPRVRELTAWALYNIEDPTTAPALQAALRTEQDKDLQMAYIRALAAMGDKSIDAIRGLLESSDPRVKAMAVRALAGGHAVGPWPQPWPQPRPYP